MTVVRMARSARNVPRSHFALDAFEAPSRFAFALVDDFDRGIFRHRSAADRHRIIANGFVDVIVALVVAPHRPFEADRLQRAGSGLRIAIGLDRSERLDWLLSRRFRGGGSIPKGKRFRLVE